MAIAWIGRQRGGGGNVQMPPGNFKAACRFQNTTGADVTVNIGYAQFKETAVCNMRMVIYSDNAGAPDALLHTSNAITTTLGSIFTDVRTTFTWTAPWVWAAGDWLWIGLHSDTTITAIIGTQFVKTNGIAYNSDTYSGGASDPFGSPSWASFEYMVWVEGTALETTTIGRISSDEGRPPSAPQGCYFKYDPHFDRFEVPGIFDIEVNSIFVYMTETVPTVKAICAIYADDGAETGIPYEATRQGDISDETTGCVADAWMEMVFAVPVILSPGTYWLGIVTDTNVNTNCTGYSGSLSSSGQERSTAAYYDFPNPFGHWPADSLNSPELLKQDPIGLNMYATFTLADVGGGAHDVLFIGDTPGPLWID